MALAKARSKRTLSRDLMLIYAARSFYKAKPSTFPRDGHGQESHAQSWLGQILRRVSTGQRNRPVAARRLQRTPRPSASLSRPSITLALRFGRLHVASQTRWALDNRASNASLDFLKTTASDDVALLCAMIAFMSTQSTLKQRDNPKAARA